MKKSIFATILILLSFTVHNAKSIVFITADPMLMCSDSVINTIYIPKLRTVADWPDDELRPYAKQLCQLDKDKLSLQASIKTRADELRTSNWRICKEVIPGNPNPTPQQCQNAYSQIINNLIDKCVSVVNMGHNPHNVLLFIDPAKVEVACLKGVNTMLQ
ncbi:MAG: hypothetical protein ACXVCY_00610 [Pseudobdellovibrionaceae bacterium]